MVVLYLQYGEIPESLEIITFYLADVVVGEVQLLCVLRDILRYMNEAFAGAASCLGFNIAIATVRTRIDT